MKFVIKQEKLEYMLEKLMVGGMFPSCVITTKEGKLFSIQREDSGRSLRLVKFNKEFFEEIDDKTTESIEIDGSIYLSAVKKMPPGMILTCETKGNRLTLKGVYKDGRVTNPRFMYRDPEGEVKMELPFEIKDGVPLVGKEKIPLDVKVDFDVNDFKEIGEYAAVLKTEFYKFGIENEMFTINVGELHDTNHTWGFNPKSKIKEGKDLDVIYTYGIPEIANTFDKTVHICTKSGSPAWFYENSKDHVLGVFIPPYKEQED